MMVGGADQPVVEGRPAQRLAQRYVFLRSVLLPALPLRIADVGANPINVPDYDTLLTLGGCEVWGFEPDEGAFAALIKDQRPGTHYLQRAIGPTGPDTFYPHPQSGLGSLYPIDESSVAYLGRLRWHHQMGNPIEMDLIALDDLDDAELPKPDLLKMDIQGGELGVFETGRKKLSEAICVIPEVRFSRIYKGEPLFGPMDVEMHQQGFRFHQFQFVKSVQVMNSCRGRLKSKAFQNQALDGDAIYIRNPETISDWTDEQIKQLAIASSCVFSSFDLTLFCLDELVRRGLVDADTPDQFVDTLPRWMLE